MTLTEKLKAPWAIVVPRGEWVDTYPTTNGRIIQGIRLAALYIVFELVLSVVLIALKVKNEDIPDLVPHMLDGIGYFIAAMMAMAVAQFGWKRATSSPELVKAESNAKIAEATVTPQPVGRPHPNTNAAIVAALESVALKQLEPVPGVATAMKEAEQPQTGTVAAAHSFDPDA